MRAGDEVGVLALPAEAGLLRQRLFHYRRGVHEHFHIRPEAGDDELREMLQLALQDVVVVPVAGVDGDVAAILAIECCQRVLFRRRKTRPR